MSVKKESQMTQFSLWTNRKMVCPLWQQERQTGKIRSGMKGFSLEHIKYKLSINHPSGGVHLIADIILMFQEKFVLQT